LLVAPQLLDLILRLGLRAAAHTSAASLCQE